MAGGFYLLVGHLNPGAPDSLSMAKPSAEEPDLDASGIPRGTPLLRTLAQAESTPANLAEDSCLTASPELMPNLAPFDRNRVAVRSSDPIEGVPMPHTNGWQTVPLGDALESSSVVNVQGGIRPDGAKVAAMPAESSPGPAFGEPTGDPAAETSVREEGESLMAYSSDPYELLPRWLREMQQKSDQISFSGNALVLQNPRNTEGGSMSAARSTALVATPKSELPQSETPGAATDRGPVIAQSETPGSAPEKVSGETIDGVDSNPAPTPAVSPAFSPEETGVAEAAETEEERTHEDVGLVKAPELDEQLEAQPNKTDLASQSKPNNPPVSENARNARAAVSETKEQDSKPALSSARLLASPESNAALPVPAEERSKPRGYITVESKPEAPGNPGVEDHRPKPQERSLRAQDHLLVGDRPPNLLVRDRPPRVQEYPSKTPDGPSEPNEKSGDLRHFASAFLQTDQNGNVADQHRFYADSVHFYGEGDLSWAGVQAATRRHRQDRQNKRYGTEGTAAVKGPIDGGFYVVEQPVSWTRAEGSRLVRGRSVLRLRVVPTNRGNWKITSIDEVRQ